MNAPAAGDRAEPFAAERATIRGGGLRGADLLGWIAARPPAARDRAVEELLGIAQPPGDAALGGDLIGYVASGVGAIVRAALEVPVLPDDVVLDLGAGLGKVTMLLELLTGARARGIELQPALAAQARASAAGLGLAATCETADARVAALDGATVAFLYLPFTGPALDAVMARLRAAAERSPLVVCALGLDLARHSWLVPRATGAFWLTTYDTNVPGAPPARRRPPSPLPPLAARIADER